MITVHTIDEKDDGCGRSKQLSYKRKEISEVLETTVTLSGVC